MKKLLFIISVICTLLQGCEKEVKAEAETEIILSTNSINFNESDTKSLFISTTATESEFQITEYPDWITVSPESGIISNEITEITINSNLDTSEQGEHIGELVIITPQGKQIVSLNGWVNEKSLFEISKSFINFSITTNSETFNIINQGNIDIEFSTAVDNDYISLSSTEGTIKTGDYQEITITVDRSLLLENDIYTFDLLLKLNNVVEKVTIEINHFIEEKIKLDTEIIDAEYSKNTDKLVFVNSNLTLSVFDSKTKEIENIELAYMPTCISLSLNGDYAIVGHDAHITYVNLTLKSIINVFDVSCYAFDIVLADNNWAYVFPKEDQHETIRCINLNETDPTETQSPYSIFEKTRARLAPTGRYIYTSDNGLSPSDMEKFDTLNGTAEPLYDSEYHGDYPFSGNFWFSEDGKRVFARGKNVFKTSENEEEDLIYNGSIELENDYFLSTIEWLDHSESKNNLYVLSSGDSSYDENEPFVYIFNSDNLLQKSKIELEKYIGETTYYGQTEFYNAEPHFVFSNSTGNEIFVLTKKDKPDLPIEWSIQNFTID